MGPTSERSSEQGRPFPAESPGRAGVRRPVPDTLRALYRQYCQVEARELLVLMPRGGVKTLWGRVRARQEAQPVEHSGDSIRLLADEAERILPLPPYEVWLQSWIENREPFLVRMGIPAAPSSADPVTVATREVDHRWWAHLNLVRADDGRWRGFLSFHAQGEPRTLRTAEIFRGDDPADLRRRFRDFTPLSLQAFLRSVLP